jgi:hypothetical protein
MMSDRCCSVDLLVIGGGKAGKSLAMDRAKAGCMVERDKIGGTCIRIGPASRPSSARSGRWWRRVGQQGCLGCWGSHRSRSRSQPSKAMLSQIRISLRSPDQRVWKVPSASVR